MELDEEELENCRGDERPRAAANVEALRRREKESSGEMGSGEEEGDSWEWRRNNFSYSPRGERSERKRSANERERPCWNIWGEYFFWKELI